MDTEEGDTASVLGKSCRKTLHSGYWVKITYKNKTGEKETCRPPQKITYAYDSYSVECLEI